MREIIDWLVGFERRAQLFYEKAATLFPEDAELVDLILKLADDERKHFEYVSGAYERLGDKSFKNDFLVFDDDTRRQLELYFNIGEAKIASGELTKKALVEAMVMIEFSECNDLFLYVVDSLRDRHGAFRTVEANVFLHKKRLEYFVKSRPEFNELVEKVRSIPVPEAKELLVVEDEDKMRELFRVFLSREGVVASACNGAEALKLVEEKEFAAIVTDVDMPVMNGIEFYLRAIESRPGIKERFLFLTGYIDDARQKFFENNNIRYLMKPSSIKDIRSQVVNIMSH